MKVRLKQCMKKCSNFKGMMSGHLQMKGIDYDETFASVARMESIKILLALACHLKFKLYQMDVKTTFLNGLLKEDVYVA